MAERRMFAKSVVLSDAFMGLPALSRCLYYSLSMSADDDGIVDAVRSIMRACRANPTHMQQLLEAGYIQQLPQGLIGITHWRINNQIKPSRYRPSIYRASKALETADFFQKLSPQDRIGKDRIGKDRIGKDRIGKDRIGKDRIGKDRLDEDRLDENRLGEDRLDEDRIEKNRIEKNREDEDRIGDPAGESSSSSHIENDFSYIVTAYKSYCGYLKPCPALTAVQKARLTEILQAADGMDKLIKVFQKAGSSPFLRGQNNSGWMADMDWLLKPENMEKLLAGGYDEWRKAAKMPVYGSGVLGPEEYATARAALLEPPWDEAQGASPQYVTDPGIDRYTAGRAR